MVHIPLKHPDEVKHRWMFGRSTVFTSVPLPTIQDETDTCLEISSNENCPISNHSSMSRPCSRSPSFSDSLDTIWSLIHFLPFMPLLYITTFPEQKFYSFQIFKIFLTRYLALAWSWMRCFILNFKALALGLASSKQIKSCRWQKTEVLRHFCTFFLPQLIIVRHRIVSQCGAGAAIHLEFGERMWRE